MSTHCYFPSWEISAIMVTPHSIGLRFRSVDVHLECLNLLNAQNVPNVLFIIKQQRNK